MGDAFDVWGAGLPAPVHTGIPDYDLARMTAAKYSAAMPTLLFFIYYSGVYSPRKRPRPLAIFWYGCQLPCPIRLTAPDWTADVNPEEPALVHTGRLEVSIRPL